MRLLVISHTAHYRRAGQLVAWGPTVRELDHLAGAFGSVTHLAPLHPGPGPASATPYRSGRVELLPLRPSGGEGLTRKLGVVLAAPGYARAVRRAVLRADVVQVRCPCNIGLVACVALALHRDPPRWAKYAGNWQPPGAEPLSYRLQRRWLGKGLHRGPVTVNGEWPGQLPHVHSFVNPCLSEEERRSAAAATAHKRLELPLRLLFVGRVEAAKGAGRAVEVLAGLVSAGLDATLDLVGDGPERPQFEKLAARSGIAGRATFHGWMSRDRLEDQYRSAHMLLLPSTASEGWPKVLSEAMAFRAVPLAGAVSSVGQVLEATGAGLALPPRDVAAFVTAVRGLVDNPASWEARAAKGIEAAGLFTYETHIGRLAEILELELPGAGGLGPGAVASPGSASAGGGPV